MTDEAPVPAGVGAVLVEEVRRLEPGDEADLERLRALARHEVGRERDGPLYLLAGGSEEPQSARELWVAVLNGHVVGFAQAHLSTLSDGRRLASVDALYVEVEARAVSLGELLIDTVVAWADAQGACGVDAVALPGARETKNFFEAQGFKARSITVHRPLSGHPGRGARRP